MTVSQQRGKLQAIRSSLPYQILLYCNGWYYALFFIAEILIFIFKGQTLPFPVGSLGGEVTLLFILAAIEAIRIFFGQKGNLTERMIAVALSIALTIPSLFGALYYLLWQTYVLRIEVVLAAIQIAFLGLELIFGVISVVTFARATPY